MAKRRVLFRLSMPGVASWNGRWSGEGRNYVLVRSVDAETVAALALPNSWYHRWSDGWCASVEARVMEPGERRPKSDGFAGYDWMVDNILRWGTTECRCEWRPDSASGSPGFEGEWERCIHCRASRRIPAAATA